MYVWLCIHHFGWTPLCWLGSLCSWTVPFYCIYGWNLTCFLIISRFWSILYDSVPQLWQMAHCRWAIPINFMVICAVLHRVIQRSFFFGYSPFVRGYQDVGKNNVISYTTHGLGMESTSHLSKWWFGLFIYAMVRKERFGASQGYPYSPNIFPMKWGAVRSYFEFPNHLM